MINYNAQLRHLGDAINSIQEAANVCECDIAKGKMYATQDMITAQINVILQKEAKQIRECSDPFDCVSDEIIEQGA